MTLVALDFETKAIEARPRFPPMPVGLAVETEGHLGQYLAWGHPTENNAKSGEAIALIKDLFKDPCNEFVFHNAPFDCSIIEEIFGIEVPWDRVHDTMLMAFLHNPHGELGLKPLAELHLDEPPEERDAVRDWLVRHGIVASNSKNWGAYISMAPGKLVGAYAIGDTSRTLSLYYFYKERLGARNMV